MFVEQWMQRSVKTIGPADNMLRAWRQMLVYQVRHLPVADGDGRLVGILSDRDIKKHALPVESGQTLIAKQEHLEHIKVSDVMVRNVVTVAPGTSMELAAHLMRQHRIDSLPVQEGGRLVGILTSADLLQYFPGHLGAEPGRYLVTLRIEPDYDALGNLLTKLRAVRSTVPTLLIRRDESNGRAQVTLVAGPHEIDSLRAELGADTVVEMIA